MAISLNLLSVFILALLLRLFFLSCKSPMLKSPEFALGQANLSHDANPAYADLENIRVGPGATSHCEAVFGEVIYVCVDAEISVAALVQEVNTETHHRRFIVRRLELNIVKYVTPVVTIRVTVPVV